jgi:hypothetical protein
LIARSTSQENGNINENLLDYISQDLKNEIDTGFKKREEGLKHADDH